MSKIGVYFFVAFALLGASAHAQTEDCSRLRPSGPILLAGQFGYADGTNEVACKLISDGYLNRGSVQFSTDTEASLPIPLEKGGMGPTVNAFWAGIRKGIRSKDPAINVMAQRITMSVAPIKNILADYNGDLNLSYVETNISVEKFVWNGMMFNANFYFSPPDVNYVVERIRTGFPLVVHDGVPAKGVDGSYLCGIELERNLGPDVSAEERVAFRQAATKLVDRLVNGDATIKSMSARDGAVIFGGARGPSEASLDAVLGGAEIIIEYEERPGKGPFDWILMKVRISRYSERNSQGWSRCVLVDPS